MVRNDQMTQTVKDQWKGISCINNYVLKEECFFVFMRIETEDIVFLYAKNGAKTLLI